jgi:hypothetical protein
MVAAIRQRVTVQPGGVIEVRSPDLRPGSSAEVIVLVEQPASESQRPLASFVGSAKGSFSSVEEVDAFIRSERDARDR